jgi:hypothetical protein
MQPGALLDVKEVVRHSDISALQPRVAALLDRIDEADPARFVDAINAGPGAGPT